MLWGIRHLCLLLVVGWLIAGAPSHHHGLPFGSRTLRPIEASPLSHSPHDPSPTHDESADCPICHLIATLTPPAPPSIDVPALQFAARLDPPPLASLPGIRFILVHRGRGPPAHA